MKVLIAGGGTGGHLYPGVALAEEITTRQKGNEVLFVGTTRGIEARVIPSLGFPIEYIEVVGLKGKGPLGFLRGLMQVPIAIGQSFRILRTFKPDFAVGVGGYASGPLMLAAWMMRIPTAILEQNTIPGITNRILSRFVDAVYVMFESSSSQFPEKKVHALGNPIRRQLMDNFLRSKIEDSKFNILVLGGSQGAHALNLRMVEATEHLRSIWGELRIVHQTGEKDAELVQKAYEERGVPAEVSPFIQDMSAAYRRADLVVCRAGATTLAEVMVAKKASILIPYPHAADNHQELNARAMVDAGASRMLVEKNLDGQRLADEILSLHGDRDRIKKMEQAASRTGRPEAAREIVDACVELVERRRR
ncbi:undecaprenyldiphospho-muramoylpentapeptide beta-N-acetylglucosaminyltransferase [Myxococcota bacterium]|nr:undecaprenyldiphospho-muramoylpentapeptide beta-N-acetylglucosaminyltransferase [Myxococcota bacterium]